jgi:hypothetical protein
MVMPLFCPDPRTGAPRKGARTIKSSEPTSADTALFDPLRDEDAYLAHTACDPEDPADLWENSFSAVLVIVAASGLLLALACPILIDSMLLRFGAG